MSNGLKSFLFFNNLSQVELADYLGISKSQMSKLVSGITRLRADQLNRILANDKGWNTEFLTAPEWSSVESGKQTAESGETCGCIEEFGALKRENELLRLQIEELKAQNEKYWKMIERLTEK